MLTFTPIVCIYNLPGKKPSATSQNMTERITDVIKSTLKYIKFRMTARRVREGYNSEKEWRFEGKVTDSRGTSATGNEPCVPRIFSLFTSISIKVSNKGNLSISMEIRFVVQQIFHLRFICSEGLHGYKVVSCNLRLFILSSFLTLCRFPLSGAQCFQYFF